MSICLVNGEALSKVPSTDRGLSFGDGLFTTAKIADGQVELLTEHVNRLVEGCQRLLIHNVDFSTLKKQMQQVAQDYHLAVLKVTITAGSGGRGYGRPQQMTPTVILAVFDFPAHYDDWHQHGIRLGLSDKKLGLNPSLAGIKHLNRLEQVLIREELKVQGSYDDLVVTDLNGHLVETTAANIFWLTEDFWYTPSLKQAGVAGLIAGRLSGHLKSLGKLRTGEYQADVLKEARAILVCNCLMGLVPVDSYQGLKLDTAPVSQLREQLGFDENNLK